MPTALCKTSHMWHASPPATTWDQMSAYDAVRIGKRPAHDAKPRTAKDNCKSGGFVQRDKMRFGKDKFSDKFGDEEIEGGSPDYEVGVRERTNAPKTVKGGVTESSMRGVDNSPHEAMYDENEQAYNEYYQACKNQGMSDEEA